MKAFPSRPSALILGLTLVFGASACGSEGESCAFEQEPVLSRQGDRTAIRFSVKAFCVATVAVETADGRIVRHLASGLLGSNVPPPFQKDAREQSLVWDGKDDFGRYVDDLGAHFVRVSLGLKAEFERSLFHEPKKRMAPWTPLLCAAPEGLYVYEGRAIDQLRLFSHDGAYVRTVYPFPADKLEAIQGLAQHAPPHLSADVPVKQGNYKSTLLTSGDNATRSGPKGGLQGTAAWAMAVQGNRIALAKSSLNRLAGDGSTGGLPLQGPETSLPARAGEEERTAFPSSAAFSPDGKTLYLSGYYYNKLVNGIAGVYYAAYLPAVMRLAYEDDKPAEPFPMALQENGAAPLIPTSVDCDEQGRVYVTDYLNDRVLVFDSAGKLLRSIASTKPALVRVHRKTGELYIFSWVLNLPELGNNQVRSTLTVRSALDQGERARTFDLPVGQDLTGKFGGFHGRWAKGGLRRAEDGTAWGRKFWAELDSWASEPTVWLARENEQGIRRLVFRGNEWAEVQDTHKDVLRSVKRADVSPNFRQWLYPNPRDGRLYVGEMGKTMDELVALDPATGGIELVALPFIARDMAFDRNGHAYLRAADTVVRFDLAENREVPWDYGEERVLDGGGRRPDFKAIAGLPLPSGNYSFWGGGGLSVAADGGIAVSFEALLRVQGEKGGGEAPAYRPPVYPGRVNERSIRIWDKHGQVLKDDAFPGLGLTSAVGLDANGDLIVQLNRPFVNAQDGQVYSRTTTLLKAQPNRARVVSASPEAPVPLPPKDHPDRPKDLPGAWVLGAQWIYGGAGFHGEGVHCNCWHSRFALDDFGRSIVPEPDAYRITILDANGNPVLHAGRYGNADSAGPGSRVPLGHDEIGLFQPNYVGTLTDRYLFIADAGNARIVSARLGYRTSVRKPLAEGE